MSRRGRGVDAKGRSKGDGKFVRLGEGLVTCEAWRSLSGSAARYYIELRRRYRGNNNGRLHLSQAEARKLLGMGSHTVQRAQAELQDKGFIVLRRRASFYRNQAAEYALTDERDDTRTGPAAQPENAWKHWRKGKAAKTDGRENKSPCRKDIVHNAETTPSRCRNDMVEPSDDVETASVEGGSGRLNDVVSTLLLESASPGPEGGISIRPRSPSNKPFPADLSFRLARRSGGRR